MFWKIIFYIWIFCTVFNLGEIAYGYIRVKREVDLSVLSDEQSLYESIWGWLKIVIYCAMPIINFIICMEYLFNPNEFYDNLKMKTEKKIEETKEKTK